MSTNINFLEYSEAGQVLERLVSDHDTRVNAIKTDRGLRRITFPTEELRKTGKLAQSDTLISLRVIDRNIKRKLPPLTNYLTAPSVPVFFTESSDPKNKDEWLSEQFAVKVKYEGWQLPWHTTMDGGQAHGFDAIEVTFDISKPGHVGFFHVGKDNLIFPKETKNLQYAPIVGIRLPLSSIGFEDLAKANNFEEEHCEKIRSDASVKTKPHEAEILIYKFFVKVDDVVYVLWFCPCVKNFLKKPTPLDLGLRKEGMVTDELTGESKPALVPQPVPFYPIGIYRSDVIEDERITSSEGICTKDAAIQEAQMALTTAFVNGANRASKIYASPDIRDVEGGTIPKVLEQPLEEDRMYNIPIKFFNSPPPSGDLIKGVQYLDTRQQEDSGNISFSTNNRVDSRKTAKEVEAASMKEAQLNSLDVLMLSLFVQTVMTYAWVIIQNRAINNLIDFAQVEVEVPQDGIVALTGSSFKRKQNDIARISKNYILIPAGDTEVVLKEQMIDKRIKYLDLVKQTGNTTLTTQFVLDTLKLIFPEDYPKYEKLVQVESQYKNTASGLLEAVKTLMVDENGQVRPEAQGMEKQISQIEQMLAQ